MFTKKIPKIFTGKEKKNSQPPRNNSTVNTDITIILLYSAKKNKAKPTAAYSTLYPETNSDSASGKSKGCLFVSAKIHIKKIINIGNNNQAFHTFNCASTISIKFKERDKNKTFTIIIPKDTS